MKARKTWYAIRSGPRPQKETVLMHRQIMGAPSGTDVDHVDGDGLNCSRANMRVCLPTENRRNCRQYKNNTSGFKGVSFHRMTGKWRADIGVDGKQIGLGTFSSPLDAALAYDAAAKEYFGEFARTNFG